jgi:hypothetical protein
MCIWNVSNGKIIHKSNLDNSETILECFCENFLLLLSLGKRDEKNSANLFLRKFSLKFKVINLLFYLQRFFRF